MAFLPVVEHLAARHARPVPASAEELTQAGTVALIAAIDRWDPEMARGEFLGYLVPCVRGEMLRWFRPGESVLVHGAAGGVGQAVARLARLSGAGLVLGTVGSPGRRSAALRAGYDDVFTRAEDWSAAARAAAGGGVQLILDPQGTVELERDLQTVAPAGRLILFGNASGRPPEPLLAVGHLMRANATIGAFSLAGLAQSAPGLLANALADVLGELRTGALAPELTVVDGLDAVADAQQALADGRANGKYVVHVDRMATPPGGV